MSEEDIALVVKIKRIEKKVDLLYEIILSLDVDDYHYLNTKEIINLVMDDLIPLFSLSAEKEEIGKIPTKEETKEWESKLKTELSRLKKIYESGDFLAKDEDKIKKKIGKITSYLQRWNKMIGRIYYDYKMIEKRNKQIYEKTLFLDLKRKLGWDVKNSYIFYELESVDGFSKTINLVEDRDILKKNLKDLVEEIHILGENK